MTTAVTTSVQGTEPPKRPAGRTSSPKRSPRSRLEFRQKLSRCDVKASPYFYIAPFFILFGLVGLFPLVLHASSSR